MVDVIIDTLLHPQRDLVLTQQGFLELGDWLMDIVYRTSIRSLEDGELNSEAQDLLASIKEENKPFFGAWLRGEKGSRSDIETHRENGKIDIQLMSQCRPSIPYKE